MIRRAQLLLLVGLAALVALPTSARGDPNFSLQTPGEWQAALGGGGGGGRVLPLEPPEWSMYMNQWAQFTQEGEPYPATEFRPAELYVYEGEPGGGGGEVPDGLVMVWGGPTALPDGTYASAWKYQYGVDPNLANSTITLSVFAPIVRPGPNGVVKIRQISFGIQDVNGNIRSWYWNVGPGTQVPCNLLIRFTIDCTQTGVNATTPPADAYMSHPAFDITRAVSFIADENGQVVGGALAIPPPPVPHPGIWNLWHDIVVRPHYDLKWQQLPDPAYPNNLYYGWNEPSEWWFGPVVADDWICTTPNPVTDLHWWGSYPNWPYAEEPPEVPSHFHITIWSDALPTPQFPFPHPGQVLHQIVCQNFTRRFIGWDFDPRTNRWEACWQYDQVLSPQEYFYQDPAGATNRYWISIAAGYGGQQPAFPWGWKTRPKLPDTTPTADAVVVQNPVQPVPGSVFGAGFPLWWPNPEDSWDMAFELTTGGQSTVKWHQPPQLDPLGLDVNASWAPPAAPYILADDFLCTQTGPITQIRVWGSWWHDLLPGDPLNVTFTLSLHASLPTGNHPGLLLWTRTYPPGSFQAVMFSQGQEGWFSPPSEYEPFGDTLCFLYTFDVPPGEFIQEGTPEAPRVYWLDVQAQIPASPLPALFGWKTSFQHWNNAAVFGRGVEPYPGPWQRLQYPPNHPMYPQYIDLAFEIVGGGGPSMPKWSQPPVPYSSPRLFNGWDQISMYGQKLAADDWVCHDAGPVTDLHWWGSFIGWHEPFPPPLPDAFAITIWTDVPAGVGGADFSHPGICVHQVLCTDYQWAFAGWDIDPRGGPAVPPETTFEFACFLDRSQWFWQEPGEHIYWVSIAAVYNIGVPPYPFGWKTRPRVDSPAPDDAVAIFDPAAPVTGSVWVSGAPLYWPTPNQSWDLAFELTTQPTGPVRDTVVCEPQGALNNPFHPPTYWYDVTPGAFGRCDFHVQVFDPNPANYTNVVAPATWVFAVHPDPLGNWWASWWDPDCDNAIFATFRFQFDHRGPSTWGDWTTTISGTGDPNNQVIDRAANHAGEPDGFGYRVHVPQPPAAVLYKWFQPPTQSPDFPGMFYGWNDLSAYWGPRLVADDWKCHDSRPVSGITWWGSYLGWQGLEPPPDAPAWFHLGLWTDVPAQPDGLWSHPGVLIREWFVPRSELNERAVGMDFHPDWGRETCFRYELNLPENEWFWQGDTRRVLWLSVSAGYGPPCNGDFDGDGDVDLADRDVMISCLMPPPAYICWRADLNGDGLINAADLAIFNCQLQRAWPDPACCQNPIVIVDHYWGWKTRRPHWNDDAVRVFEPTPPRLFRLPFLEGQPIETPEGSWDTAFALLTPFPPPPPCRGDTDCDYDVDFDDIDPFVAALSGEAAYLAQYPWCRWLNADCDGDGDVDFDDIDPFVALIGSPCPNR